MPCSSKSCGSSRIVSSSNLTESLFFNSFQEKPVLIWLLQFKVCLFPDYFAVSIYLDELSVDVHVAVDDNDQYLYLFKERSSDPKKIEERSS